MPQGLPIIQTALKGEPSRYFDFDEKLASKGMELRAGAVETLQVNVGKLCNQACKHCHVDAGPARTEVMTRDTMGHCLAALDRADIPVLDVTGGAPELNPDFRWLVGRARAAG